MRRSLKITVVIAIIASFLGFMFSSSASAKSSAKAENVKAVQKVLPNGMPQGAKQSIVNSVVNADPSLPVNQYIQYYTDYMTGDLVMSSYVFSPTADDPYAWSECSAKCSTFMLVKKGNKTSLVSKLLSNETLVFGNYNFSNETVNVGASWNGTPLPMKSSVKWMGQQNVVTLQFAMVGLYNSAYPVPEYYYPGEK